MIGRLDSSAAEFDQQLTDLLAWETEHDGQLQTTVIDILAAVRREGDVALLRYTNRFDRRSVETIDGLVVDSSQMQAALARIEPEQREALETAKQRIEDYHQHQRAESWQVKDEHGSVLGQKVSPIARVGVYVPGGKASYPSSVLMSVMPAKVAGVAHITMMVPAPDDELNDMVLAAACLAGVDQVVTAGGAQAIAALAYGTKAIAKVDKIVGPGNRFVAEAKRQVYGSVGLDMIAGPSEILIVCDGDTPADWIAMDLFSQAEHDELAQSILLSPSAPYLDEVAAAIERLLPEMERRDMIATSLKNRGALVLVKDMNEAIVLSNKIAPEHLELSVDQPEQYLSALEHAGAIFMGRNTPEAFGDYCAGPNHVLPTSSTARFSSPLGVYDFQKRTSIINCSTKGAKALSHTASVLARSEFLTAHARSAEYRNS